MKQHHHPAFKEEQQQEYSIGQVFSLAV